MIELFGVLGVVLVVTLGSVIWALRGQPGEGGASAANTAVFRQRLEELERDRALGEFDEQTFRELEADLQKQLLAETRRADSEARRESLPPYLVPLVVLAVLAASAGIYRSLGAWPELAVSKLQQELAGTRRFTPEDIDALARAIDTSLAYRPDNTELRFWNAQLAVEQGDYDKAVANYRELLTAEPQNPMIMAQLAQAIFLQQERTLTLEARQLMERAIQLDPNQTTALGMLGMDAFERGDYRAAVTRWSALLATLPPQAAQARVIREALAKAKELALDTDTLEGIAVRVGPGEEVRLPEQGVLYVFAKAAEGPGFPLAVVRQPVSNGDWPRQFVLTPADAMRADMTLDQFEEVKVTARYSRSGSVAASSGDIEGHSGVLRWRDLQGPVELVLDRVVP